jgi:N-acetylmuramoyl-L-alanine amidase
MPTPYAVQQGDCLSSIGKQFGMNWKTIWNDGHNADLKSLRKDPNVLYPGDQLIIPDLNPRTENGASGQRHKFVRKGVPAKLKIRVQLLAAGKAKQLSGEQYELHVDGKTSKGSLDGSGMLTLSIPPDASSAYLRVRGRSIPLTLGTLDPVDTVSGQQARLNQLGYNCGDVDGIAGPKTEAAMRRFQKDAGLGETGDADAATISQLKQQYGG